MTLPDASTEPMIPDERPEEIERRFGTSLTEDIVGRIALFFAYPDTAANVGDTLTDLDGIRWHVHRKKANRRGDEVLERILLASANPA